MSGVLLDTHALIWLYDPAPMSVGALIAVEAAARADQVFVSPISAWELAAASRKNNLALRPKLRDLSPESWFVDATRALDTISAPITEAIGLVAAALPNMYGYADPGDCLLIATAHVHQLTFITRDQRILEFAHHRPDYLKVVRC